LFRDQTPIKTTVQSYEGLFECLLVWAAPRFGSPWAYSFRMRGRDPKSIAVVTQGPNRVKIRKFQTEHMEIFSNAPFLQSYSGLMATLNVLPLTVRSCNVAALWRRPDGFSGQRFYA
jgi:hypothetical protein